MKKITTILVGLVLFFLVQNVVAQEEGYQKKIETLKRQKDKITAQEKRLLKQEIEEINKRLESKEITKERADVLKTEAAKKRALNIDDRLAIIDNRIALLKRNKGLVNELDTLNYATAIELDWGTKRDDGDRLIGVRILNNENRITEKDDRRTYSDIVLAVGLNNAIIDGQSLNDSPYRIGGSRFFEIGSQWRTRVFKNTNFLRFHYGFSFQFNGLKQEENNFFVVNGDQTELQEFEFDLRKSKFRMDNLVFPVHFEFGPSKFSETDKKIRYSIRNQFRIGIGGYGGFNIGSRQKLKFRENGDNVKQKIKSDFNTSDFIYGLSTYIGFDGVQLYAKYDLNPIFEDAIVEQKNISLGVRFDLD